MRANFLCETYLTHLLFSEVVLFRIERKNDMRALLKSALS
jgi:hypothetical protein